MNNPTQTQPTVAEYMQALAVLKATNKGTMKAIAQKATAEDVDHLANALAWLAGNVATRLFEEGNALKKAGKWREAVCVTLIGHSVGEYDSAVEQAHEISGSLVNTAFDRDETFFDIKNEADFSKTIQDILANA